MSQRSEVIAHTHTHIHTHTHTHTLIPPPPSPSPQVKTVKYNDEVSSDEDHDAYLEKMKAEGLDRDSEDGELRRPPLSQCTGEEASQLGLL